MSEGGGSDMIVEKMTSERNCEAGGGTSRERIGPLGNQGMERGVSRVGSPSPERAAVSTAPLGGGSQPPRTPAPTESPPEPTKPPRYSTAAAVFPPARRRSAITRGN